MKILRQTGLLMPALFLAACGGGSDGLAPPDPQQGGALVAAVDAFPDLPDLAAPTKVLVEPGVLNPRWFILQKDGLLVAFDPDTATALTTFIDLTGVVSTSANEGGLLGMAFHPDYPLVPEIFLSYTVEGVGGPRLHSIISRLILNDVGSPSPIGAGTLEQIILEVDQPFSNHNGGDIAFGGDRLLYIGLGDGGGSGDPQETAQDTTRLLGSFLRIEVIGTGADYTIPAGNPFANQPRCGPGTNVNDCPEIFAWGFRNPWRWSFDPQTGALWVGDVGQNAWEEVDLVELGGNYGWDCREGAHDFETDGCSNNLFIDPVAEYGRSEGQSITGGFVYRGAAIPDLVGRYVFGDFGSGRVWSLRPDGAGGFIRDDLFSSGDSISSFSVDPDGELYFADYSQGRIMQLVVP